MEELKELLMASAREKGICAEGLHRLGTEGRDELVDYYLSIPDWCLERNYPALPVLREHFSGIEDKGVFVGKTFHGEVLNDLQTYIFHNCKGTITVELNEEKGIIPMLYLANKCRMRIVGDGDVKPFRPSVVPVYTFGKNDVSARSNRYVEFQRYENELI